MNCTRMQYRFLYLFLCINLSFANGLLTSLERYKAEVHALRETTVNTDVLQYLTICSHEADVINYTTGDIDEIAAAFSRLTSAKIQAMMFAAKKSITGDPVIQAEQQLYDSLLVKFADEKYYSAIAIQNEYLKFKYFKNQTTDNSNFIEGFLNGWCNLTKGRMENIEEAKKLKYLGVNPNEILLRVEPVLVQRTTFPALIATAGLNYTIFPELNVVENDYSLNETFFSKYIGKIGIRLGAGIGKVNSTYDGLFGGGAQVSAFGIWVLYHPTGKDILFGISSTDLSFVKQIVPWFN